MNAAGLRVRARVLATTRAFFATRGYLEVPTPVLVPSAAMEEHLFPLRAEGGLLRTSPEFALKRAVAAGLGRIYEIGPCFRGREDGPWHGTEFLMLEWYRVGAGLRALIDETRELVQAVEQTLGVPAQPWREVTVRELFAEVCGVDLATASASDLSPDDESWDEAFFRRWVTDIEPSLTGAVVVTEWPASQAALAQVRTDGAWPTAQRFEVYYRGVELANAFFELLDSSEQRARFMSANAARLAAGEPPHPVDEDFVQAVGRMPVTAGIALGLDRLVAAVAGWEGIDRGRVH
ncbi:MAG: EF-P lysine aminoacylase GenX [Deltaproteobacteria bacterium]|nr:MAG: EF-P lysine aminoacylase GenX [Deltaproteobacteria bacterium]